MLIPKIKHKTTTTHFNNKSSLNNIVIDLLRYFITLAINQIRLLS